MAYTKLHDQDETEDCDNIWWETTSTPQNGDTRYLIYFVPGNPCVVEFYRPFLYEVFKLLSDVDGPWANVALGASSLPGFEIHPNGAQYSPSGLNQQIENVEKLITQCSQRYQNTSDKTTACNLKVVLVAHSVGAYMVLEALRRRSEALNNLVDVHIVGAVLLFPTVTEISRSWHGSVLKVKSFLQVHEVKVLPVQVSFCFAMHLTTFFHSHSAAYHISQHWFLDWHGASFTPSRPKAYHGGFPALEACQPTQVTRRLHSSKAPTASIHLCTWPLTRWQ
jgi:pimeloyl-ACP methyl ester carboxylesterase